MLNYPANYQNIAENEMEYLNGGAPDFKGLFDHLIGNYARDLFMGNLRSAVWNSAVQSSTEPLMKFGKNFTQMGFAAQALYLYGAYRLAETIFGFLNK